MSGFNPQWIVGKRIASVDMRQFDSGRDSQAHDPIITFDDGSSIRFVTQETEGGEYGTAIVYRKAVSP